MQAGGEAREDVTGSRPHIATATGGGLHSSEGGCFDCNICLDVAQDPVVTLCGHLYCWPCLCRWLRGHATCQECPVCKSLVEEDKVVPLYARGGTDPRKKFLPDHSAVASQDGSISRRPAGLRPEPAHPSLQAHPSGFSFSASPLPMATARFGNAAFSTGYGLFPSLFNFRMHSMGFGLGYPFGVPMVLHGAHSLAPQMAVSDQQEAKLSRLLLCLGFLLLCYIVFF